MELILCRNDFKNNLHHSKNFKSVVFAIWIVGHAPSVSNLSLYCLSPSPLVLCLCFKAINVICWNFTLTRPQYRPDPTCLKRWIVLSTRWITFQWISVRESNCITQWIQIYLVDSRMTLFKQMGLAWDSSDGSLSQSVYASSSDSFKCYLYCKIVKNGHKGHNKLQLD